MSWDRRTYQRVRNVRRHATRPRTIGVRELQAHRGPVEVLEGRPRTRADCICGPRPCPWVGCRYHLYLDVHPRVGSLTLRFPDLEPDQLEHSCALDLADRGPIGEDRIAPLLNCTRTRVQQLCQAAMEKLERPARRLVEPGPPHPGLRKCGIPRVRP